MYNMLHLRRHEKYYSEPEARHVRPVLSAYNDEFMITAIADHIAISYIDDANFFSSIQLSSRPSTLKMPMKKTSLALMLNGEMFFCSRFLPGNHT